MNAFNSLSANQPKEAIRCKQRDRASATASSPRTTEANWKSFSQSPISNTQDKLNVKKISTQNEASSSNEEICLLDLRKTCSSVNLEQSLDKHSVNYILGENIKLANNAADDALRQIKETINQPRKRNSEISSAFA